MELILHIGAHRTGTTTFQRFLNANRDHLRKQDIAYWGPGKTRSGMLRGLMRPPHKITPEDQYLAKRSRGRIGIQSAQLDAEGIQTLVVSEENMLGGMFPNLQTQRLYPDADQRIARIAAAFAPHPKRVGLSIRSYDRYWASVLSHCIKNGHAVPTPQDIEALAVQPVRWTRVIRQIAAAFPNAALVVWPFEALIGLPELQLGALLGGMPDGPFAARREWHNASLAAPELQRQAREAGDEGASLPRMGNTLGRWHPFNDAQTALMRAAYAQDLAWLRAGADGLATYIDGPEDIPGAAGQGRGRLHDERETGVG